MFYILVNASQTLHNRMFESILKAPVVFFDRNPIGKAAAAAAELPGKCVLDLSISCMRLSRCVWVRNRTRTFSLQNDVRSSCPHRAPCIASRHSVHVKSEAFILLLRPVSVSRSFFLQ